MVIEFLSRLSISFAVKGSFSRAGFRFEKNCQMLTLLKLIVCGFDKSLWVKTCVVTAVDIELESLPASLSLPLWQYFSFENNVSSYGKVVGVVKVPCTGNCSCKQLRSRSQSVTVISICNCKESKIQTVKIVHSMNRSQ